MGTNSSNYTEHREFLSLDDLRACLIAVQGIRQQYRQLMGEPMTAEHEVVRLENKLTRMIEQRR